MKAADIPGLDAECARLIDAMNSLPGITTFESCCGHGKRPFRIFFSATEVESLRPILELTHPSAGQCPGWRVEASWSNGGDSIYFMLESVDKGVQAYTRADNLARQLSEEQVREPHD